ncbi:hypothetical protein Dsin_014675 [Dipteronia sinensis]|uniref:DNA-directed DNA polymerase family A palm domain-containing protein n=1 Tax=Dipteronia sinensis TaxID=43782 RepID=A0AAE0EBT6_9ROSI|nr:hypothetical protein Dsin_014675 [Dipteronia sinensis]
MILRLLRIHNLSREDLCSRIITTTTSSLVAEKLMMLMVGVSSTATKGPFFPWPSSVSSSSSRFLSSASFNALKSNFIHTGADRPQNKTTQNKRKAKAGPGTRRPKQRKTGHESTQGKTRNTQNTNKKQSICDCLPMEDAPTQMMSRYLDLNSLKRKPWPDFDFRSHSGPPVLETGHTALATAATPSIPSTPDRWDTQRKIVQMMKGNISYNEEVGSRKHSLLQNSKPPSGAETKDTGFGSEAVDYVNGDSKKNNSSQNHFAKEPNAKLSRKTPNSWEKKNPKQTNDTAKKKGGTKKSGQVDAETLENVRKRLSSFYSKVRVVDNIAAAKEVVRKLTGQYRHWVHACDTEVAKIDVKQETPIDHGELICFSIYSGPEADFGHGKSCIWVDVLDGGGSALLNEFAPFFEDPAIKKVWHNYSFHNHVFENYGIKPSGFHADTMHMERLWDSLSPKEDGYSLEALTGDPRVMYGAELEHEKDLIGTISMKTIFPRKKLKKDGSEGKTSMIPPVEELQRKERILWICYSALYAVSTWKLHESLEKKLVAKSCKPDKKPLQEKSMLDFYREYWLKFGEILVKIETEGMLVDRPYLAEIEKVAKAEREVAVNTFRNWASKYCPDAKYMNVGSVTQLRHFLFGRTTYSNDDYVRIFKVPNTEGVIEEGKKTLTKFHNIKLRPVGITFPIEVCKARRLPSVKVDTLKRLVAKISAQYDFTDETADLLLEDDADNVAMTYVDEADSEMKFHTLQERREACHAIASLCKVRSIDSLISNFILPLQGSKIAGKDGRVHCSLNINTETGRLSARRTNLQNQPALEKDRYKIRQAFIAAPGHSLIVADYGQVC